MVGRLIVAAVVVGQSCGTPAASMPLSPGHLGVIRVESFVLVERLSGLPGSVREALQVAFDDGAEPLLDPQDSVPLFRLPWQMRRQLVIGACGPDHCLIQYEYTGSNGVLYVLVLGINPDNAQIEWSGMAGQRAATVDDLRAVVLRVACCR